MERKQVKSIIFGFIIATALFLSIGAIGQVSEVGRYQLVPDVITDSYDPGGRAFIIDTQTGAAVRVHMKQEFNINSISVDGDTIQQLLEQ